MRCLYCADPVAKGRATRCAPPGLVVGELSALLAQTIDHFHTCDSRFFLPTNTATHQNYNYNDNQILVRAIAQGARGAYWAILRRLREAMGSDPRIACVKNTSPTGPPGPIGEDQPM